MCCCIYFAVERRVVANIQPPVLVPTSLNCISLQQKWRKSDKELDARNSERARKEGEREKTKKQLRGTECARGS